MPKWRYVGDHAQDLHDGRVVAPGESFTLTQKEAEEPHNQVLQRAGVLVPVPEAKKQHKAAAEGSE